MMLGVVAVARAAFVVAVVPAAVARAAFVVAAMPATVARAAFGAAVGAAAVAFVAFAVLTRAFRLGAVCIVGFGRGPCSHAEAEGGGHGQCQKFLHVSRFRDVEMFSGYRRTTYLCRQR